MYSWNVFRDRNKYKSKYSIFFLHIAALHRLIYKFKLNNFRIPTFTFVSILTIYITNILTLPESLKLIFQLHSHSSKFIDT